MRAERLECLMPQVGDYLDARCYVRDFINYLKATEPGFSFRKFTKRIGMASPGHIHMMISGRQALTERAAQKLARGFDLNKIETRRFMELILLEQVSDLNAKESLRQKILSERMRAKRTTLAVHQFAYCANWYYPVIRELVGLSDFRLDLAWIANRLSGEVSQAEVSKALQTLLALGLIRSEGDSLVQSEPSVTTDDQTPSSLMLSEFHKAMLRKAQEAQDLVAHTLREISGMTLTLDESDFESLRSELMEFRNQVFQKYGLAKPSHDRVYQVNLQFFPLTK